MKKNSHISIVLAGEAGQGVQTVEFILTRILKLSGYNVFATKEYMSRIRGGNNSTLIRVSSKEVCAYVSSIDILVPLDKDAIGHLNDRISDETLIIGEKGILKTEKSIIDIPFSTIAKEIGSSLYSNIVAVGLFCELFSIKQDIAISYLKNHFSGKSDDIIENNVNALLRGFEEGKKLVDNGIVSINIEKNESVKNHMLLNGVEAVGLGCLAGNCDFVSSYPMSPSTGLLVFLASHANKCGLIVEQVEDEISAINMSLGAWFAGARGIVTTSGGGFALMTEGISLAGMIESPAVVHIAQRPGPATGLPTRTEQGDLNLVLYAGHGEYPRVIFAPGNLAEAFALSACAFTVADKYQVPVFILTDQYFVDSYYNINDLGSVNFENRNHIVKTDVNYKRYALGTSPLSPRGIPGYGDGLVLADSDEHDEDGHITEDLDLRIKMQDKRMEKLDLLRNVAVDPDLIGSENYSTLFVAWGSNYSILKEAIEQLDRDDIAFLHIKQLYPLSNKVKPYLQKAKNVVVVENNATAQFAQLILLETGFKVKHTLLKYNGLPFSVEEFVDKISKEEY